MFPPAFDHADNDYDDEPKGAQSYQSFYWASHHKVLNLLWNKSLNYRRVRQVTNKVFHVITFVLFIIVSNNNVYANNENEKSILESLNDNRLQQAIALRNKLYYENETRRLEAAQALDIYDFHVDAVKAGIIAAFSIGPNIPVAQAAIAAARINKRMGRNQNIKVEAPEVPELDVLELKNVFELAQRAGDKRVIIEHYRRQAEIYNRVARNIETDIRQLDTRLAAVRQNQAAARTTLSAPAISGPQGSVSPTNQSALPDQSSRPSLGPDLSQQPQMKPELPELKQSQMTPPKQQPLPGPLPQVQSGGVRNSTGPLPEGSQRVGAYSDQAKSDGVRIGGREAASPTPTTDGRVGASPPPRVPNETPVTGSRASTINAKELGGVRTEVRDIGSDRRVGAFETSKPRDVATGASNQAAAARTQDSLAGGVRTESQQPAERRIGAFADNPAFQRLKDEFKRPDMNLRATAQTGTAPQVATRMQSGMPEAYRQELAERERQQREEQERIRRENEAARRAALEDGWRRMNEAQRNANPNADPNNRCRIDYHHVGELPKECESTASKPQIQGRYSRWKTVDFFTNFPNYPISVQMGVCNLEFDNNDLYSFAKEYVDSFVPSIQAGRMRFHGQGGDRMNNYYFEVGRTGLATFGQAAPYVTDQIRVTRTSNRQVVRQYFGSGIEIRNTYERCDP